MSKNNNNNSNNSSNSNNKDAISNETINKSPRSTMRVDTQVFQSADNNNDDIVSAYGEDSVIACLAADDSMDIVLENNETHGVLLTQTNEVESAGYEVQSV